MDQDRHREAEHPPFEAWLLTQASHDGFVGALATAAAADRRFPKAGDPEAVRKHLREAMADGDMFDAIDDAEADWKAAA